MPKVSQVIKAAFPADRTYSSDEWYTPENIMISVRAVLGQIELDPCSCGEANKIVRARKFYTLESDGLSKNWKGKVWLNPPRGIDERVSVQSIWCKRLLAHYHREEVPEAMFIIRNCLGYHWFNEIVDRCPDVCFLRERPAYYRGFVSAQGGQDQLTGVVFYLGKNVKRFQEIFSPVGYVFDQDSYR